MANKPDAVFLAAAKVGGILANDSYPADFLYKNLMIEANVIEAARLAGVAKLLFLGSSCIYPKLAEQPIVEEALLTGPARADQRVVRRRQDRRHQAGPGLSAAVRLRLHQRHADQPLRPGRQLRPAVQPRHPGPDAQGARGQDRRRAGR
jgi:nucleoside-diphosphate-sugar epimerase